MGRAARPLYDPGNHGSIKRRSDLLAARRGSLRKPARPAGEREDTAALTPYHGTRSRTVLSPLLNWIARASEWTMASCTRWWKDFHSLLCERATGTPQFTGM